MVRDLRRILDLALASARGGLTPAQVASTTYDRMGTSRDFHRRTLKHFATAGWAEARCVFVLSTGRAGSMQLAAVLGGSPDVLGLHEPAPTLLHIGARAYAEGCRGRHWRELVHGVRDEFIAFAHHEGRIYAETNNRLTYLAPALAEAFPASRFVHLHRDPLQVIRSGLGRGWYSGGGVDFSLIRPREDDPFHGRWAQLSDAQKIAWFWTRVNEDIMAFFGTLPAERRMTLAAADFFRADPGTMRALFGFIGAREPPAAAIARALGRQLNATPAAKGKDKADRLSAADESAIATIVGDVARTLGYAA